MDAAGAATRSQTIAITLEELLRLKGRPVEIHRWLLTIVGGVREALLVWLRGR
jgi:hypothetical protein